MRKSKARESIINTAQKLIEKKGYSNLNVNEVAYIAEVSVGTLYYHFPGGKVDILAEIMSRRTEGFVEKATQQLREEIVKQKAANLEDMLRVVFKKVIELRRTDRHFLAAIQNEFFSNPDDYLELIKKYQLTDGIRQGMGVLSDLMLKTSDTGRGGSDKLAERQDRILKVVGLLMVYQIIFPGYFGDDDDFVDMAVGLFLGILKS